MEEEGGRTQRMGISLLPNRAKPQTVSSLCVRAHLILCDPMDCSPSGSFVHGILQARVLEWVAISFSRGSSQPRNLTWVSCIAGRFLTI